MIVGMGNYYKPTMPSACISSIGSKKPLNLKH